LVGDVDSTLAALNVVCALALSAAIFAVSRKFSLLCFISCHFRCRTSLI
jgi:hypothetical protein